ncbi:MAG: hypothetical protein WAO08_09525 [Hyphomicrobiaceae bacterium]
MSCGRRLALVAAGAAFSARGRQAGHAALDQQVTLDDRHGRMPEWELPIRAVLKVSRLRSAAIN